MRKKSIVVLTTFFLIFAGFAQFSIGEVQSSKVYEGEISLIYRNATVYAPAVAETSKGYKGVMSTITVTIQNHGSGRVFVDTLPLAQMDMQGSARLAVKVASSIVEDDRNCTAEPEKYDYFFVVRTDAPIIGGPSAGAIMAVTTVALLKNVDMNESTVMTGMINPDGSIGPVGGISHKIDAAAGVGAKRFLLPKGQMIQRSTSGAAVNLSEYSIDNNYGIEVKEVADVKEAVKFFTGVEFYHEKIEEEITTIDYKKAMDPLAENLINEADEEYEKVGSRFENTSFIVGGISYKSIVEDIYSSSEVKLNNAIEWFEKDVYYTCISNAFQSLIHSRQANYLIDFFKTNDTKNQIEEWINDADSYIANASTLAKNSEYDGFISLQCVGAAQRRISEAENYLEELKNTKNEILNYVSYYSLKWYYEELTNYCFNIAYSVERSKSVKWWLNISNNFNDAGHVDNNTLYNITVEYIHEAEQAKLYSGVLLEEMGVLSDEYLNDAESLLSNAKDDLDDDYVAAAFFESLEALVNANLAIETIGADNELLSEKIERAKQSASESISETRNIGMEPVLSVSYFEFAENLLNQSDKDKDLKSGLFYYKYSDMIAGALDFTNISTGALNSRYVGVPKIKNVASEEKNPGVIDEKLLLIFLIGLVLGTALSLIVIEVRTTEKEQKEKWIPRSIKEYEEKTGENSKQNITPRSIEDYYKKNK